MIRNIDKMYYQHGYGHGFCHECPHFRKKCWNKKAEKKIIGYNADGSEKVEYESFIACGLIDKEFPEGTLTGQISITELAGDNP